MKLNKTDLIIPQDHFTIKTIQEDKEIAIRHLTQTEIQTIKKQYYKATGTTIITEKDGKTSKTTRINTTKNELNIQEAKLLALSYALSCDGVVYSLSEIELINPKYIEIIWNIICEMNNINQHSYC